MFSPVESTAPLEKTPKQNFKNIAIKFNRIDAIKETENLRQESEVVEVGTQDGLRSPDSKTIFQVEESKTPIQSHARNHDEN